jgi:hypothetical protein
MPGSTPLRRALARASLLIAFALGMVWLAWPRAAMSAPSPQSATSELPYSVLGFSQGGLPLIVKHLGTAPNRVFILGGQHGGPESNTTELAEAILDFYVTYPWELPPEIGLDVMPVGNPDGAAAGIRQYLSGVDPNRNWGTHDWQTNTQDSNGAYRPGLGGEKPFSEPETRALRDWLLRWRPALIVNYHSAGGFMFGTRQGLGAELSARYAEVSGYYWGGAGGPRLLGYRVNGSMGTWQNEQGFNGIFVELSDPWDPELERNLAALRATVGLLAEAVRTGRLASGAP